LPPYSVALLALVAYLAVLAWNARIGQRRSDDLAEYYVGGRRLGGWLLGTSFFATYASTNSYIGNAGKGYLYGIPWFTLPVLMFLFTVLSWKYVAPRMRRFAAATGALTVPEFLEQRFPAAHGRLRAAAGLIILGSSVLFLMAIFKGAGHLFELFFAVSYSRAIFFVLMIVVLYTAIGGFHSVVRTDVLQGVMMMIGAVVIFWHVTAAAGGVGVLSDLAAAPDTAHLFTANAGTPYVVLLGISLAGALKLLVDPRQISRFYGLRDERSVRQGLIVALVGIVVIQVCLFPIGIYAHALLDGVTDTDLIVPTLLRDPAVFAPWVSELLLVAVLAAAMSSLDSVLLVAASVLQQDLLAPRFPALARYAIAVTRAAVVAFALLAAVLALDPPGGIVELTIFSGSLYAVCFLPPLLLGLYWSRGDAGAVLAAMGLGIVVLFGWRGLGWQQTLHEVFPALGTSLGIYVALSFRRASAPPAAFAAMAEPRGQG
jgi:SSS family transporter